MEFLHNQDTSTEEQDFREEVERASILGLALLFLVVSAFLLLLASGGKEQEQGWLEDESPASCCSWLLLDVPQNKELERTQNVGCPYLVEQGVT